MPEEQQNIQLAKKAKITNITLKTSNAKIAKTLGEGVRVVLRVLNMHVRKIKKTP